MFNEANYSFLYILKHQISDVCKPIMVIDNRSINYRYMQFITATKNSTRVIVIIDYRDKSFLTTFEMSMTLNTLWVSPILFPHWCVQTGCVGSVAFCGILISHASTAYACVKIKIEHAFHSYCYSRNSQIGCMKTHAILRMRGS